MEESSGLSGMDSWPVPVLVQTQNEKLVRLTGLPKSLKQRAWDDIKANSPTLASLLKDESLREVVEHFSAEIFIEAHIAPCLPPESLKGRKAKAPE